MPKTTHGLFLCKKLTPDYARWSQAKGRCYCKTNKRYKRYGGRGIKMFEEWINDPLSFIIYVRSLDNYGMKNYSIDRINNDGNYEPGNLRWASRSEQAKNRNWFTRSMSDETKVKISSSNVGKTFSEESKKKMSDSAKKRRTIGRKLSDIAKKNMSIAAKNRKKK